jgi:WD40 repeat protein
MLAMRLITWNAVAGALLLPALGIVGEGAKAKPDLLQAIPWLDAEQRIAAHIYQTGIAPDGKLFFGAGDAGPTAGIRVYEVATGKQFRELRPGVNVWFSNAAFVPGGKYLVATYSKDRDIYLWDLAAGKVVRKLTGHAIPGIGVDVSPDGKQLMSWGEDSSVLLWDLEAGKELHRLRGHADKAAGVFAPDGKTVLTFSPDKTLRLWDAATGKQMKKLTGHAAACTGSYSPDGKRAVSFGLDETARLWDLTTGKEILQFVGANVKAGVRGFVDGGRKVAAYCEDGFFRVWETTNGRLVQEINLTGFGGDRWTVAASPDVRLALFCPPDGAVRVYDLASGKVIHRYANCRNARAFSFTPDGQFAVAGSFRAGLFVFRLPSVKAGTP